MNGSTAKLLRRYSHISGHPYRDLKRIYKRIPGPERFVTKQKIRTDITRLKKLKSRNTPQREEPEKDEPIEESFTPKTVPRPAAATSKLTTQKRTWWQVVWGWIKSKLQGLKFHNQT